MQLPTRVSLNQLAIARQVLHLVPTFEFKYHKAQRSQKETFFKAMQDVPFSVHALVIDKSKLAGQVKDMNGLEFTVEFITHLALRYSKIEAMNDILVIDGGTPILIQALRIRLSKECRYLGRNRLFKKIVSADSKREDGLQLADMVVGAVKDYVMGIECCYFNTFKSKVVDLWEVTV